MTGRTGIIVVLVLSNEIPDRIPVNHNGVKIHDNLEFPSGEGPLHFQNHGNPVVYRNIWVQELK